MWRRRRQDDDFREEIKAHLALETDRLVDDGLSREEARAAAHRRFGNVAAAQERFYESRRLPWLDGFSHDVRVACRSISKYPVACAIAVISLAGGIGSATATLAFRDAVFRKPPALYDGPDALHFAGLVTPETPWRGEIPASLYRQWAGESRLHRGIAAWMPAAVQEIRTPAGVATARVRPVTPELFSVLGVTPALGRPLSPADLEAGRPTAVLSYRVWRDQFDGRADAVGSVVWVADQPHTVVGVMPERFWFAQMDSPIWTPLDVRALPGGGRLQAVLRRRPDVTPDRLLAGLQQRLSDISRDLPPHERHARVLIDPIVGTPLGRQIAPAIVWLLSACVALTLMIAATNAAVLLIAQWTAREREIAIRASLGAGRAAVLRLLLTESMVIAACGGLLGMCATFALRGVLLRIGPAETPFFNLTVEPQTLAWSAVLTLLTGILAGIGPALYESGRVQAHPLRLMSSDRVRQRWRHALVIAEITVTIALLVVTATMFDAYRRAVSADLGFDVTPIVVATVRAPSGVRALEIRERLARLPGVVGVAAATSAPPSRGIAQRVAADAAGANATTGVSTQISPGFFATLGVAVRRGRPFGSVDDPGAVPTVIVNETLARRVWPGLDPLGRQLWIDGSAHDVIGVVADYTDLPLARPFAAVFTPLSARAPAMSVDFVLRAAGNPADLVQIVRTDLQRVGSDHSVQRTATLASNAIVYGDEVLTTVYTMIPLMATGILLTAAGIYGVLAFAIARRAKELAVRAALGATALDLVRLVTAHSLRLVAIGIVLGVGATFTLSRLAQGEGGVFDSPRWSVFAIPAAIIVIIGLIASYVPSRRAALIDPAVTLRAE
jgi:predicted permease